MVVGDFNLSADISDHYPIMLELADMKEFPIVQNYKKKKNYDPTSIKKIYRDDGRH